MPNWCSNQLVITGAREDRERFAQAVIGFPDENEREHILKEERRYRSRPRDAWRWSATRAIREAQGESTGPHISDVTQNVDAASVRLGIDHPTREQYAEVAAAEERERFLTLDEIAGVTADWDEVLAALDEDRARDEAREQARRAEIGLEMFDEHGMQARLLAFSALDPPPSREAVVQADHWGTKWEPDGITREMTDDALAYRFTTAWDPPNAWLIRIARWYPELTFRLAALEADSGIARMLVIENGAVMVDESVKLSEREQWYRDAIAMFDRHGASDFADGMRADEAFWRESQGEDS